MTTAKIQNVSLRLSGLAWLVSALSGCIADDRSNCPVGPNVKIGFTLFDKGVFSDEITSVTAVLFDGQENWAPSETTLDHDALGHYAGVDLTLDPGDYRMVFWANVGDNTRIGEIDGTPVVVYKEFDGTLNQVLGNGDPVWYAPAVAATRVDRDARPLGYYEFTVSATGNYIDRVAFTQTHNTMNVFIGGLSPDPDSMPTVEITNLTSAVNFYGMQPLDDPLPTVTSAVKTVLVTRDDVSYALAAFNTFPLGDMAGMELVIKDAAGSEIFRVPLIDAVTQSGIDPTAHEINQLIDFGDLDVTMKIWDWDNGNLEKEL